VAGLLSPAGPDQLSSLLPRCPPGFHHRRQLLSKRRAHRLAATFVVGRTRLLGDSLPLLLCPNISFGSKRPGPITAARRLMWQFSLVQMAEEIPRKPGLFRTFQGRQTKVSLQLRLYGGEEWIRTIDTALHR
jgi:hypothetical protein